MTLKSFILNLLLCPFKPKMTPSQNIPSFPSIWISNLNDFCINFVVLFAKNIKWLIEIIILDSFLLIVRYKVPCLLHCSKFWNDVVIRWDGVQALGENIVVVCSWLLLLPIFILILVFQFVVSIVEKTIVTFIPSLL